MTIVSYNNYVLSNTTATAMERQHNLFGCHLVLQWNLVLYNVKVIITVDKVLIVTSERCMNNLLGDDSTTLPQQHPSTPLSPTHDPATYLSRMLDDNEKLEILRNKWSPPAHFSFTVTGGRKYNQQWEVEYPWLRYSVSKDAAFCVYCMLFGDKLSGRGVNKMEFFQKIGFQDWKNAKGSKRGALPGHEATEAHKTAAIKALSFLDIASGHSSDIQSSLSKAYEDQVKKNRAILLSIIDVVIALGQRNVALRGHGWDKATHREDGNFDFFLHWKSEFDPSLKEHLKKHASYTSPQIQNEIIALAGAEIRDCILNNIRSAGWCSVMADESTDVATCEQMSICLRFVDQSSSAHPEVREEFVGFVKMDSTDAASISEAILQFLRDCNLDIANLRGQGYDGASVMAGKVAGVSARILQQQLRAVYHHCRGHNLNLVIASSCK